MATIPLTGSEVVIGAAVFAEIAAAFCTGKNVYAIGGLRCDVGFFPAVN